MKKIKILLFFSIIINMKTNFYKNHYSNKSIKNIGKKTEIFVHQFEDNQSVVQKIKSENSYKYVENNQLKLERTKTFCWICNKKCGNTEPIHGFYDYKTKSKKKRKGIYKREKICFDC